MRRWKGRMMRSRRVRARKIDEAVHGWRLQFQQTWRSRDARRLRVRRTFGFAMAVILDNAILIARFGGIFSRKSHLPSMHGAGEL